MPQQRPPRTPIVGPGQLEHHHTDMTATFSADLSLSELQNRLAQRGQWLPIDGDPAADAATLVLGNSTGPLRLGYGAWRDLLLGMQFNNGRGELITVGGRVVKNVAGYDLTKLLVGSHGVFGRLVTLTTRTYRRPAGALHAQVGAPMKELAELLNSPLRPQWLLRTPHRLWLGYLGDQAMLDHCAAELSRRLSLTVRQVTLEQDIALRAAEWPASERRCRVMVPPARLDDFLARATMNDFAADPTFGIVLPGLAEPPATIRQAAQAVGGTWVLLDESRRPIEVSMEATAYEALCRLKRAFDPDGVLVPLPRNVS